MPDQIAQLVKAASADGSQWGVLYKMFYPGMFSVALRICGERDTAADAVHDAFVTAYLKIAQLKDPAKFAGWMKQIVIRTCHRAIASNKKHRRVDIISSDFVHHSEDAISKTIEESEKNGKFFGALASLPESLNLAILLRYFSSYQSYEDIASILRLPIGTVRSRLHQAKTKLTEFWREQEDIDSTFLQESEQWNSFYREVYGEMHRDDNMKDAFVRHVSGGLLASSDALEPKFGNVFDHMVIADREAGSWLQPTNVFSGGNITVIEANHFNSADHPDHCPRRSVVVIQRNGGTASNIHIHVSRN